MIKRNFVLALVITMAIPCVISAQTISGKIVDKEKKGISDVIVSAFSTDSTFIALTMSKDNGSFEIKSIKAPVILHFNHIAYIGVMSKFDTQNIGELMLEDSNNEIEQSVVTAYRRNVKMTSDGITYNFKSRTQNTTVDNVYEAISKLPGVKEKKGSFSLAGAGEVTIVIDGKPTLMDSKQLEEFLKSTSVEKVKSAKVMYLAPADYQINGAVIDLTLAKESQNSYSAYVSSNYEFVQKSSYSPSVNIGITRNHLYADFLYNYGHQDDFLCADIFGKHSYLDNSVSKIQNIGHYNTKETISNIHNIRTAIDYSPKDNQSLAFIYQGKINPNIKLFDDAENGFINSIFIDDSSSYMHTFSLRYQDPCGLEIGADYVTYHKKTNEDIKHFVDSIDNPLFSALSNQLTNNSKVDIYGKMTHKITDNWKLGYGIVSDWSIIKSSQTYRIDIGSASEGEFVPVDNLSTDVIGKAHLQSDFRLSKGELGIGIISEFHRLNECKELNFYPQLRFSWSFDEDNKIMANITGNRTYGSYRVLSGINNYSGYINYLGNTDLRPSRNYKTMLNYVFKQTYSISAFYNYSADAINEVTFQDLNNLRLIYKIINLDYIKQYGMNIDIPFSISTWLDSDLFIEGFRTENVCKESPYVQFDNRLWTASATLDNNFILCSKPKIILNISAMYSTPALFAAFKSDPCYGVDAGLKIGLLKNALNISFKVTDIFESVDSPVYSTILGNDFKILTNRFVRCFRFNVSYRFREYSDKTRGHRVDTSRF